MEITSKPLIKQGWLRAAIYLIGVALIVYLLQLFGNLVTENFTKGTEDTDNGIVSFFVLYAIMGLLIVTLTFIVRKFIDRQSFKSLGFSWKGYTNEAGLGFFGALAILGIGSIILIATGYVSFTSASIDTVPLLIEIAIMAVVAFVEELLFRGYLLNNLLQSMNKWIALAISSVLFAVFHQTNPDITVFAILNIVLAGVLLGLNYIFTKNLWFGIFFHFAWNYFQGPVLGYDVSGLKLSSVIRQTISGPEVWTGGPFGFEGSLLCPILFMIAIFIFGLMFIKRYQPVSG